MLKKISIAVFAFNMFCSGGLSQKVELVDKSGILTFRAGNKDLLGYQYKTVYPSAGQDTNYKKTMMKQIKC